MHVYQKYKKKNTNIKWKTRKQLNKTADLNKTNALLNVNKNYKPC